jgi:spore maturation protein CgeB
MSISNNTVRNGAHSTTANGRTQSSRLRRHSEPSPALAKLQTGDPVLRVSNNGKLNDAEPPPSRSLKIVILGLSITSSWGNGHATTYRALVRELAGRGHRVLFLERDLEWYAKNRDLPKPPYARVGLYSTLKQLKDRFSTAIRNADMVMVGSYVHEGAAVGEWVTRTAQGMTAFYDIDTPVTLANLLRGNLDYLTPDLIPRYDIYCSFTGGPILEFLQDRYGSRMARPLYCSVDAGIYFPETPETRPLKWDLAYMGTYSDDRQPALDELLLEPARRWTAGRFVVAGPQYPRTIRWPKSVKRFTHLPPSRHRQFYNSQRFTLNVTRQNMVEAGYSPSVRLFEAAACGTPIISDFWEGLDTFFVPDEEILISRSAEETLHYLHDIGEEERRRIGDNARRRVLDKHTSACRAGELESYAFELLKLTRT